MNRAEDWSAQARRDVQFARDVFAKRYFEWACFAAHQAAEKGLKALALSLGGEP